MHRSLTAAAAALAFTASAALASDVPLHLSVEGRPIDAAGESGYARLGVTYVNLVRAAKAFAGKLAAGPHGRYRVTLHGRTLRVALGSRTAELDGRDVVMAGAPFRHGGDPFVPLATFATFADAGVRNLGRGAVDLALHGDAGIVAAPSPGTTAIPAADASLRIAAAATVDTTGLHVAATVTNATAAVLRLAFPGTRELGFTVTRDGAVLYDSAAAGAPGAPASLEIAPAVSASLTAEWITTLAPGRYAVRTRLLTLVPHPGPVIELVVPAVLPTPQPPAATAAPAAPATTRR